MDKKDVVCIYTPHLYIYYIHNGILYVYQMEYYLAIKKNEIMPFAATWMDLEIILLSEVRQRKTNVI